MPHASSNQFASPPKHKSYLKLFVIFGFILAISNALSAYIHSSYLSDFVGQKNIGLIFTATYLLTFLAVLSYTSIINWLKIFRTTLIVFVVMIASLFGLGIASTPLMAVIFFLCYIIFLNLIWITLDIYIEYFSNNKVTGRIRGIFWSGVHIAWFISPITSGYLLKYFDYSFLFLIAACLAFFVMIAFSYKFRNLKVNHFPRPHFFKAVKQIYKDKLLNGIYVIAFLLQCFYVAMVVYAPLYLHEHIGIPWHQIGIMFTIMLSTFVFTTYPAGWLADKYFGEKEMLSLGLVIMGFSVIIFGSIESAPLWAWTAILFMTRIGASLVQIMRDSYFFKRVDVKHIHLINLFRNTTPIAYIIFPLIATLILTFFDFRYIFIVVGVIVLSGLFFSTRMQDTK
ncbi:MFS transporter [Candidatus Falkowbacteria bacterium]|nr:MFS transporter [Candidatus Falkowbacteria bacterium]